MIAMTIVDISGSDLPEVTEIAFAEPLGFVARDVSRKAAIDHESAKRDDERLQANFGDEKSLNDSEEDKSSDGGKRSQGPGPVPFHEHDGEQNSLEGEGRSDGQVDSAGDNDDSHADAEDPEHADQMRLIPQVRLG
jgi:hypothetical protein